jgi:hypothetical protein
MVSSDCQIGFILGFVGGFNGGFLALRLAEAVGMDKGRISRALAELSPASWSPRPSTPGITGKYWSA